MNAEEKQLKLYSSQFVFFTIDCNEKPIDIKIKKKNENLLE